LKVRRCGLVLAFGEGWCYGTQKRLDRDNQAMPISLGQIWGGNIAQWLGA